jgi:hypothetical protein
LDAKARRFTSLLPPPFAPGLRLIRWKRGCRYSYCWFVAIPHTVPIVVVLVPPRLSRRRVVMTFGPSAGPPNGERVVSPCPTGEHAAPPDVRLRARRQRFLATGFDYHESRGQGWEPVLHIIAGRLERWSDGEVYRGGVERGQLRDRAAFAPVVEPRDVINRCRPETGVFAQVGYAKRHDSDKIAEHLGIGGRNQHTNPGT